VKDTNIILGVALLIAGLTDVLIVPVILQRFWTQPPPQSALVLKMVRITGLIMIVLGVLFLARMIVLT